MKQGITLAVLAVALAAPAGVSAQRVTDEVTGTLTLREGQRLRVVTDIGNVRVVTAGSPPGRVSYRVRVETESAGRDASAQKLLEQFRVSGTTSREGAVITGATPWKQFRGRLRVNFEVHMPRRQDLEVRTGAGNIDLQEQEVDGRVVLSTGGGNVMTGRLDGPAEMETAGGHILLLSVGGNLKAVTGGGHIKVERVEGTTYLRTGGGHIKVGSLASAAELYSGGGNITVKERAGGKIVVESAGGQIYLGEVAGPVQARTGGGGIQIVRLAGPTQIQTGGGSIYLQQVQDTVYANTGVGKITAWFTGKDKKGTSQLICGQGDILVYLPRDLAVNIEATIEMAGEHRVEADPALPLQVRFLTPGPGPRTVQAQGVLNGGGETIRLRTVAGNITLLYADSSGNRPAHPPADMEELIRREMEAKKRKVEVERRAAELAGEASGIKVLENRIREMIVGYINVDAEVQQRRLLRRVQPLYPDKAKRAGIEGKVWLHAMIGTDGRIEELDVITGHPWLVESAVQAVQQWRYQPTLLSGKPVRVATVIELVFRLQ